MSYVFNPLSDSWSQFILITLGGNWEGNYPCLMTQANSGGIKVQLLKSWSQKMGVLNPVFCHLLAV